MTHTHTAVDKYPATLSIFVLELCNYTKKVLFLHHQFNDFFFDVF